MAKKDDAAAEVAKDDGRRTTASGNIQVWLVRHKGQTWHEGAKMFVDVDVPGQWMVMIQTAGRIDAGLKPTRWAFVCEHFGAPVNLDPNIQLPPQFNDEIYEVVRELMPTVGRMHGSSMPNTGRAVEL